MKMSQLYHCQAILIHPKRILQEHHPPKEEEIFRSVYSFTLRKIVTILTDRDLGNYSHFLNHKAPFTRGDALAALLTDVSRAAKSPRVKGGA